MGNLVRRVEKLEKSTGRAFEDIVRRETCSDQITTARSHCPRKATSPGAAPKTSSDRIVSAGRFAGRRPGRSLRRISMMRIAARVETLPNADAKDSRPT